MQTETKTISRDPHVIWDTLMKKYLNQPSKTLHPEQTVKISIQELYLIADDYHGYTLNGCEVADEPIENGSSVDATNKQVEEVAPEGLSQQVSEDVAPEINSSSASNLIISPEASAKPTLMTFAPAAGESSGASSRPTLIMSAPDGGISEEANQEPKPIATIPGKQPRKLQMPDKEEVPVKEEVSS